MCRFRPLALPTPSWHAGSVGNTALHPGVVGWPTRPHRAVIDRYSCDTVPRGASEGALARCDGLLLSSHARLLVVLPLAKLFQETLFFALFLEATDGAVDRLVLLDANPGHAQYPPPQKNGGAMQRPPKRHTDGPLANRRLAAEA